MKWIKRKLRSWLGIENNQASINDLNRLYSALTSIGIDVHFKEPHMILIFSKLKGGQIRHIDAHFENLSELNHLAKRLKEEYRPRDIFYDFPMGVDKRMFEF